MQRSNTWSRDLPIVHFVSENKQVDNNQNLNDKIEWAQNEYDFLLLFIHEEANTAFPFIAYS